MKKSILVSGSLLLLVGCTEMKQVANESLPAILENTTNVILGQGDVSSGLKQALELGVTSGVQQLGKQNGFLNNSAVKILYPEELQKVDKTLRSIGLGSVADEGLKLLNRAAEDAVTEAAPIFKNAITSMSFSDATSILMGGDNAATNYLKSKTTTSLETAFEPKVKNSFSKVGADKVWNDIITKYNSIPTVKKVNPDLTNYVTQQAINGLFTMVAQKEAGIRNNVSERTTPLLQKVFAKQD
ncbi:MAG: DUF4197 domain-containing protein [Flavobacteriales bacterium]|nr:DUF4197 domain-containing protein [Flavobacteriales bacterium]